MTIQDLYNWAKENEVENSPLAIIYWNEDDWEYYIKEVSLSQIDKEKYGDNVLIEFNEND